MRKILCFIFIALLVLFSPINTFAQTFEEFAKEYNVNKEKAATQPTKQDLEECYTLGTTDGAKQRYLDNIYSVSYTQGFNDAIRDCYIKHPLLIIALNIGNRNYFIYEIAFSTDSVAYKSIQLENFEKHHLEDNSKIYDSYCQGYNEAYSNNSTDDITSIISAVDSKLTKNKGYSEGHARFCDINLAEYKTQHPTEALFTASYFFYFLVSALLVMIVVHIIRKCTRNKRGK